MRDSTLIALVLLAAAGCAGASGGSGGLPEPTSLEYQGEEALNRGSAEEARTLFLQATRGRKCPFLAWVGVARASLALGDARATETAIGQAMTVDPGTAASADLLGRTLLMSARAHGVEGRTQAKLADAMFAKAGRLDPKTPRLAYHRGVAHLAANEPGTAAMLLERAATTDPMDEDLIRALVLAYERSGRPERARALLDELARQGRLPPALAATPE